MKKLIMMVIMAGVVSAFAAANDPLIPAHVEAGQTYALLCKGEVVRNYTANATMDMNFQGDASLSDNVADYEVVPVNSTLDLQEFVCTYSTGAVLAKGERLLLVKCTKGFGFKGLNWDGTPIDSTNNEIIWTGTTADANGKFVLADLPDITDDTYDYQFIVLDTRLPNGEIGSDANGNPKVVCGWGEFVSAGDDLSATSIRWNKVTIGLTGTAPEPYNKTFDFDPTPYLANGFATVSPSEGVWEVYQLPQAWVEPFTSPDLSLNAGTYWHLANDKSNIPDPFKLESAYKFSAFDIQYEEKALAYLRGDLSQLDEADYKLLDDWNKQVTPFKEWNADFEVSFDRPVAANSVLLAGFYNYTSAWAGKYTFDWVKDGNDPWVGSSPEKDLAAGEVTRLLYSYIGKSGNVTMTYNEICTKVIQFFCGVKNLSEKNYGTTMTVKLCIYENTGRCHESGSKIVIGTYRYTFSGPLSVVFADGPTVGLVEGTVTNPDGISTNYDGQQEFALPLPTYDKASNTNVAFVGWSNAVNKTVMTCIPTNTWGSFTLYSTWKKAQTVVVSNEKGIVEKPVKVTEDWIEANVGTGKTPEEVKEALNEPVGTEEAKGTLKKWEAYVLGLDATNPNAAVKVDQTAGAQEDKAIVLSTVQAPPPDSGFKVAYALDKVEGDEETVTKTVDQRDTNDLSINLEPEDDTPTGYYKMNVIGTPDGEGAKPIKYPAENTIGVLKVESEEKVLPVAVPWLSLEEGTEVMPDEIVDPRTLSEGDQLHVWQESVGGQKNIYVSWHIEGGKWVANPTAKVNADMSVNMLTAVQARDGSVKCGKGVWLERKDTTKPFYLVGQYDQKAESKVKITAGTAEKAEYNLIAPTVIEKDGVLKEETDLNAIPSLNSEKVNQNDQLMIIRKGVPTYFRRGTDGKWGYNKTKVTWVNGKPQIKPERYVDDTKVSIGLGLWYISAGGEPTVDWKEDEQAAQ